MKKGNRIRAKVVDSSGEPMSGVWMAADTWRTCRTLNDAGIPRETGVDGMWEWDWAPEDEVQFDVLARGYASLRNQKLVAREKPYEIVLRKPLQLKGTVTDKETGQPIKKFAIVRGTKFNESSPVYWESRSKREFQGGVFELIFDEPRKYSLLVTAPGFLPTESRLFDTQGKDHGDVTCIFELVKGKDIVGQVVFANGSTVQGAEVAIALAEAGNAVQIANGRFENDVNVIETDETGKFSLPPTAKDYLLIVIHDVGYAEVSRQVGTISNDYTDTMGDRRRESPHRGKTGTERSDLSRAESIACEKRTTHLLALSSPVWCGWNVPRDACPCKYVDSDFQNHRIRSCPTLLLLGEHQVD